MRFSPLLIGDRFEAGDAQVIAMMLIVSVPSSSGIGLKQSQSQLRCDDRSPVSVPSSSGIGLKPLKLPRKITALCA